MAASEAELEPFRPELRPEPVVAGDVRLQIASCGVGPPLLFLHGVGRCYRDVAPLAPALSFGRRLFALDHRGHGGSSHQADYRVKDYVQDAVELLRSRIAQPTILYGHSLGALVAAAAAAAVPDLVAAVILEDPPSAAFLDRLEETPYHAQFSAMQRLAGKKGSVAEIAKELADVPLPAPGGVTVRLGDARDATSVRFSARCLMDLDPAVWSPLLHRQWLEGYDVEGVFRGVLRPTLLLCGDVAKGGMLPAADADRVAAWLPDGLRVDFPGAGHLLHWMETEKVLRLVHGFLQSL